MTTLEKIRIWLADFDPMKQIRYFAIGAGTLAIINIALMVYGHHASGKVIKEIANINKLRRQAQQILQKNVVVEQKKQEVESILTKDPSFKIKEFFDQTLEDTGLSSKSTKEPEIGAARNLNNGYSEIKLEASFSEITMQDITELILALEKNPRIFTKDLSMSRNKNNPKALDVTITIATLQPTAT